MKVDFAMQEAMEDAGMEAKTYGIWGLFWKIYQKFGGREKQRVKKKDYIWLAVLAGWSPLLCKAILSGSPLFGVLLDVHSCDDDGD